MEPKPDRTLFQIGDLVDGVLNPYLMRKPCKCGCVQGYIRRAGEQDVVRCMECNAYQYNAPRSETKQQRNEP